MCSRFLGHVTDDEFRQDTLTGIALARAKNTRLLLIDDSELESVDGIAGLYELPQLNEELGIGRRSKAALILPPRGTNAVRDAYFYATVCRNRGCQVSVFAYRQEAIEWLLDGELADTADSHDG